MLGRLGPEFCDEVRKRFRVDGEGLLHYP